VPLRFGSNAPVRRLLLIAVVALPLAACGGSSKPAAGAGLSDATARTVAAQTANFQLLISGKLGTMALQSSESGSVSFSARRAHFYKLVPGGGTPQEIVLNGPYEYTNANIDAALKDSSVKPWTKLDTRRVPLAQRKAHPDELMHVRAVAYLSDGVGHASKIGSDTVAGVAQAHYRGIVDPAKVVAASPAVDRAALRTAVGNDYLTKPFPADFWIDEAGRVRRVLVTYSTPGGGQIVVDGRFSDFGVKLDLSIPAASKIQDITP
jgi:hypothetical protein